MVLQSRICDWFKNYKHNEQEVNSFSNVLEPYLVQVLKKGK